MRTATTLLGVAVWYEVRSEVGELRCIVRRRGRWTWVRSCPEPPLPPRALVVLGYAPCAFALPGLDYLELYHPDDLRALVATLDEPLAEHAGAAPAIVARGLRLERSVRRIRLVFHRAVELATIGPGAWFGWTWFGAAGLVAGGMLGAMLGVPLVCYGRSSVVSRVIRVLN